MTAPGMAGRAFAAAGAAGRAAAGWRGGIAFAHPYGYDAEKYGSSIVRLHSFQAPFSSTAWLFGYIPPSMPPPGLNPTAGWNSRVRILAERPSLATSITGCNSQCQPPRPGFFELGVGCALGRCAMRSGPM